VFSPLPLLATMSDPTRRIKTAFRYSCFHISKHSGPRLLFLLLSQLPRLPYIHTTFQNSPSTWSFHSASTYTLHCYLVHVKHTLSLEIVPASIYGT